MGRYALVLNTTGSYHTALGYQAGYSTTTGYAFTAVGYQALYSNTTGIQNTAVGGYCNYTGVAAALRSNTTGSRNTAMGNGAAQSTTSSSDITAFGTQALWNNTTGSGNTGVGSLAGTACITGTTNTYIGASAGAVATNSSNTFVGCSSGELITGGAANTIIGRYNGNSGGLDIRTASNYIVLSDGSGNPRGVFDASGNFMVGATTASAKLDVTGDISISNSANAATANFFGLNASLTTQVIQAIAVKAAGTDFTLFRGVSNSSTIVFNVFGNGNVTNTNNSYAGISDVKLKENIVDATPKLANLMQVKVRNYNLKSDPSFKQIGVIAQELETIFPTLVEETKDSDVKGNDLGTTTKSVKYSVFVPMLIKAMQEQQAIIESLKARLDAAGL